MKTRAILACDPGKLGGLVCLPAAGPLQAHKMPEGAPALLALLRACLAGADEAVLYLEQVGGFVQGRERTGSSMFAFGEGYGLIQGMALAYDVELHLVRPQVWMQALGLGVRAGRSDAEWKRHLKAHAQTWYPEQRVTLKTADALLLHRYAMRCEAKRQVLGGDP